jgi:UDP-N-acetylmuramyl tripeptide synthase
MPLIQLQLNNITEEQAQRFEVAHKNVGRAFKGKLEAFAARLEQKPELAHAIMQLFDNMSDSDIILIAKKIQDKPAIVQTAKNWL